MVSCLSRSRACRSRAGRSLARVGRVLVGHSRDVPFNNSYHLLPDLTKRVLEVDALQIDTVEVGTLKVDAVDGDI